MEKKEILQNLYNIRAGLSTISVRKDQVVALDQRIAGAGDDIQSAKNNFNDGCSAKSYDILATKNRIEDLEKSIEKKKRELEMATNLKQKGQLDQFIESSLKPFSNPYPNLKKEKKPAHGKMFFIFGFLFFINIFLLIFGIISFIIDSTNLFLTISGAYAFGFSIVFVIPCGIVFGIRCSKYRKRLKEFKKELNRKERYIQEEKDDYAKYRIRHIAERHRYYQTLPESIKEDERLLDKLTSELPIISREFEDYKASFPAQEKSLVLKKSNLLLEKKATVQYANAIYKTLSNDYGSFLSVGDWQNLDYIIYLFETNRADTVKEALILLDEVKRHEMLIKAMGHISNTIREGFGEMKSAMMSGFSSLSSRLFTMSMQMDSITSLQESHSEIFQSLTNKVDVFTDLSKKINTSSEEMAKDLDFIKRQYY